MNIEYDIVDECWVCTSHATNRWGYPAASINGVRDTIHRHYYRMYKGDIPSGMVVRHICDNPRCINPDHLLLGTHADNVRDRVKRNRGATGVRNGRAKLTEADVIEIYCDTERTHEELARTFGIAPRAILSIKKRETWRRVTESICKEAFVDHFRQDSDTLGKCAYCMYYGVSLEEFPCSRCIRNPGTTNKNLPILKQDSAEYVSGIA